MAFRKISLDDLIQRGLIESVNLVLQSQDPEIYLAEAEVAGQHFAVTAANGQRLMTRSLAAMKRALCGVPHRSATLRHRSGFDEMIGNPVTGSDLALEMPIKL